MLENSDLDSAGSIFDPDDSGEDSDAITENEENHSSRLITGFSDHGFSQNIRLSAYGSSRYALVFDGYDLVIYNPDTSTKIHYKFKADVWWWSAECTFTSIIAYGDDFFLSVSNGCILSCLKGSDRYWFIPSTMYVVPGYVVTQKTANIEPKKLLGANEHWLIYLSTCRNLVFLPSPSNRSGNPASPEPFILSAKREIKAHAFCSATGLLWVVVKVDRKVDHKGNHRYCLYKIDPSKKIKDKFEIEIPRKTLPSPALLAVSSQGDVVFENYGVFLIYQPANDGRITDVGYIGDSSANNYGGYGCFATYDGKEYFIFCGRKYVEISIIMKTDRGWQGVYGTRLKGLTKFDLEDGRTVLTHLGFDGLGRLVIKVRDDHDGRQKDQGLLVSFPFSENFEA